MKLPENCSSINYDQKKIFVEKIIELYGDKDLKQLKNSKEFWKYIVEFFFSYIFSDNEQRAKIRDKLNRKYDSYEKMFLWYIQKLNKLNIEANEFKSDLNDEIDIESLENQILSL